LFNNVGDTKAHFSDHCASRTVQQKFQDLLTLTHSAFV